MFRVHSVWYQQAQKGYEEAKTWLKLSMPGKKIQQTTFWKYFSYFFQKIGSEISCTLSPKEAIAWNVKANININ